MMRVRMTRLIQMFLTVGMLVIGSTGMLAASASNMGTTQSAKQFKFSQGTNGTINYLLFLPQGYSTDAEKRWPLMLFLHGAGERGTNVWRAAIHGPPSKVASEPNFPFILVSPLCPEGEHWSNDTLM